MQTPKMNMNSSVSLPLQDGGGPLVRVCDAQNFKSNLHPKKLQKPSCKAQMFFL
jgi:hypothetical protein